MADWVPVIVAVVGAGGPITVMLTRLDRRNTEQHAASIRAQERTLNEVTSARRDIQRVEVRLDKQTERMDAHVQLHLDQALNDQ